MIIKFKDIIKKFSNCENILLQVDSEINITHIFDINWDKYKNGIRKNLEIYLNYDILSFEYFNNQLYINIER